MIIRWSVLLFIILRFASAVQVPDTAVVDQNGSRLSFYTDLVKGRTVAVNFIFTTCKTICPPMTATFRKVQQELGERVGQDIRLISISVDPATDTPQRLRAFADKFQAGPGWTFVTGSKPEIDALLRSLGAFSADKLNHSPTLLIGNDRAGYWTRASGLAPAKDIVQAILETAGHPATATPAAKASSSGAAAANYFPNLEMVTHEGKTVRFFDDLVKANVVLINFMFATCTGVCSPMTQNLSGVQQYLGKRLGQDIRMISITVDPENDTPEVLAKYAETFHARPGWYFLTGKKENVDWVLYKLGGYVEEKNDHTTLLIVGNAATGEWIKVNAMSNPADIGAAVMRIAH